MARNGGVLVRAGHTEAGCDLAALAGLEPSAVICEILNEDGTMARLPDLIKLARLHHLKIGTISDLIQYRAASETLVERILSKPVTTAHGDFVLHIFNDRSSSATHLALTKGNIDSSADTLVRVHGPVCVLDFLDPTGRPSAFTIDQAQEAIARAGTGVIVLMCHNENCDDLQHRARGDNQSVEVRWDPRIHGIGAQILHHLGVRRMRLMASPRRIPSMTGFNLEISEYISSPADLP